VGDGQSIRIREDKWLKLGTLIGPSNREEPERVTELINKQTLSWKEDIVQNTFEDRIANEILAIPIPSTSEKDKLIWTETISGNYTVKSGYNQLRKANINPAHNEASPSYQKSQALWCKIWRM